jgi:hypothetical protein
VWSEKDLKKPWQNKMWCSPAVDAEFVARTGDVLDCTPKRAVMPFAA